MSYTGLKAQSGLNATELEAVKALSQVSKEFDGVAVKLNYSLLDTRKPEQITDFLYYQDGEIVGYMPLDCFGTKAEITAVVHPEYRRRGIFNELYSAAMACPVAASCSSILMVNYRNSEVIGHIGWIHSSNNCYIRGVGILPAWRGKGWGRSMIAAVMRQELQTPESAPHLFELDVATQNESALSIYRSCGFESVTVYDYYTVPVPI